MPISVPHRQIEDNAGCLRASLKHPEARKHTLVALGQWALTRGHWPLVWAVTVAIQQEGLSDA